MIPKELTIGARKYRIVFPHTFREREDITGYINYNTGEILITDRDMNGEFSKDCVLNTLFHEIIHGIGRAIADDTLCTAEHDLKVCRLAEMILCFLKDNYPQVIEYFLSPE